MKVCEMDNNDNKKINLDECKKIMFQMLVDFDELCRNYDLKYYLVWGTLIGTVRHKGFVPWDDDIDVAMPREDYNKLITLSSNWNKKWNEKYSFLCFEKDNKYPIFFGKFSDNNTVIVNRFIKDIDNLGLYIDVFPIDNVFISEKKIDKTKKKLMKNEILQKLASMKKFWPSRNKIANIIKYITYKYASAKGCYYWEMKRDNLMNKLSKKRDNDKYCVCGSWVLQRKWFEQSVYLPFENKKFSCPIGYDEYLRARFGDYMVVPPKEKQISQHDYDAYYR